MKYKNKGFSLLELMLVLVFIVAASAIAYKMFKPSQTQAAVRQEQQNVGKLVDGIMGAYSTAANFSTLSTATAAGVLNLPFSANGLDSAMKTDVTVRPATSTTSNDSFDLVYASLSPDKCIALIPALSSRSSAILLAASLYLSGVITNHWKWWPHLMVLVGYGFFVPQMVAQMGQGMGRHHPIQWRPTEKKEMSWLLKLGTIFNAVNFLGRRLIIPAMILTLAHDKFGAEDALPVLGATLGLIGVLGSLARAPVVLVGNTSATSLLKWGARLSLLGWAMLSISLLLLDTNWGNTTIILSVLVLGWAMMEFTNRTWAIAYMEQLRLWTVGPRFSAARAHRRSLHRFMVRRASGGAVGCAVGGIVGPALAPAMVVVLLAGCWWWLEKMPAETTH